MKLSRAASFGLVSCFLGLLVIFGIYWTELIPADRFNIFLTDNLVTHLFRENNSYIVTNATRKPANQSVMFLQNISHPNTTVILAWTTFFGDEYNSVWMSSCPTYNCRISSDRKDLDKAVSVVFHIRDFKQSDVPKTRYPWQRYVFHLVESPYHTGVDLSTVPNFFNWTMTYRRDSDIYNPYGNIVANEGNLNFVKLFAVVAQKSKMAAWIVSNCHTPSKRDVIVNSLSKHIQVDIYGHCGRLRCPNNSKEFHSCDAILQRDYFFYLSFENSNCLDYVTEKFFERIKLLLVPIVLVRYNYDRIAPPKSFIAVDDFGSIEDLANYLTFLSNNITAYMEYFSWRQHHSSPNSTISTPLLNEGFCGLCRALQNTTLPVKSYSDMNHFWHTKAQCGNEKLSKFFSRRK